MKMARWLVALVVLGAVMSNGIAGDPTPSPTPGVRSFTGGWGKGSGSSKAVSRLDGLSPQERRKTAELDVPLSVKDLGMDERMAPAMMARVRVTNTNPYPVFFQCRVYQGRAFIQPGWNVWKDGKWKPMGWAMCGTGLRDRVLQPKEEIELGVSLLQDVGRQQVMGRFYRADKPSVQSDCVLYERQ